MPPMSFSLAKSPVQIGLREAFANGRDCAGGEKIAGKIDPFCFVKVNNSGFLCKDLIKP